MASLSNANQETHPSRTLHVYAKGLAQKTLSILDSDKQTPLYVIKTRSSHLDSKPDISIYRSSLSFSEEALVGTAKFHTFSRTIDLQVGSSAVPLKPTRVFSRSVEFESGIGPLKWEYTSAFTSTFQLVNARGVCLARFKRKSFSFSKLGHFEILVGVEGDQPLVDQIVISGVALLEKQRREENNTD